MTSATTLSAIMAHVHIQKRKVGRVLSQTTVTIPNTIVNWRSATMALVVLRIILLASVRDTVIAAGLYK